MHSIQTATLVRGEKPLPGPTIPHDVLHVTPLGNKLVYLCDQFFIVNPKNEIIDDEETLKRWHLLNRTDFIHVWKKILFNKQRVEPLSKKQKELFAPIVKKMRETQLQKNGVYSTEVGKGVYQKMLSYEKNVLINFNGSICMYPNEGEANTCLSEEKKMYGLSSPESYQDYWQRCSKSKIHPIYPLNEEEKKEVEIALRNQNRQVVN